MQINFNSIFSFTKWFMTVIVFSVIIEYFTLTILLILISFKKYFKACFYSVVTCQSMCREDLAKPAGNLYLHNLNGILETAIRATNAQYDDIDILKRLDVRLLEVSVFIFYTSD